MTIQNLDKTYIVLRQCEPTVFKNLPEMTEQFICTDNDGDSLSKYRIARIKHEDVTSDLVLFLSEVSKNKHFSDFVEYFTDSQYMYIVLLQQNNISLREKMERERLSFADRFEICKKLLEQIILYGAESYFMVSTIDVDSIGISATRDIYFQYDLSQIQKFNQYNLENVFSQIGNVMKFLFESEIKRRALDDIEIFIKNVQQNKFEDLNSLFGSFYEMYQQWVSVQEEELESKTILFKLWEVIKIVCFAIIKVIPFLVILLAIAYLAFSIWRFSQPSNTGNTYEYIGTMKMKE